MILKEELEVTYHEIDTDTKAMLETFQDILKTLLEVYHAPRSGDKRGKIKSLKDFKQFKKEMIRYHNYPFMQPVIKQINQINQELIDSFQSKREIKKIDLPDVSQAIKIWKSGNIQQSINVANKFSNYIKKYQSSVSKPLEDTQNPFYIENPLIFRSTNFLNEFEKDDIEYVSNLDLNKFKYSYLNLNELTINNFQYIAYFLLNLSDKPSTITIKGDNVEKLFKMVYSGPEFDKLLKLIEDYLSDNKKENIPEILELIEKFPKIKSANENAKKIISTVYRGYPTKESKPLDTMIATSKSKNVAMRFALQIGHMERPNNRRSEIGTIETYTVSPDAIILDTTIFGGIYNEQEVIIDVSKADLVDVDEI